MNEDKLIDKLRRIEALFAGAKTNGERDAADRARQRIQERLKNIQRADPPVEHKFRLNDIWQRQVFVALLRRYGIRPYRYSGQRHTTVMARVPRRFVRFIYVISSQRRDVRTTFPKSQLQNRAPSPVFPGAERENAGLCLPSPGIPLRCGSQWSEM